MRLQQSGDKNLVLFPRGNHSVSVELLGETFSVKEFDPVLVFYVEFGVRRVRETFEDPEIIDPYEYYEVLGRVMKDGVEMVTIIEDGVECVQVEPLEQEMKEWLKGHLAEDLGVEMVKRVIFAR